MTLTIRQHLEHVRLLTQRVNYDFPLGDLLKEINEHAVAALKALDESDREFFWVDAGRRLVPDPAPPTRNT